MNSINRNNCLLGLHSKLNCGKDLVGQIIQYLTSGAEEKYDIHGYLKRYNLMGTFGYGYMPDYEIKKYADKLKDIVCLLIGCTRAELEDRIFKEKELGEEWRVYKYDGKIFTSREEAEKAVKEYYWWDLKGVTFEELYEKNITTYVLTPRLLTQLIGTDCFRKIIHPNSWVNATFSDYKPYENEFEFVEGNYIMGKCSECGEPLNGVAKYQRICKTCVDKLNNEIVYPSWVITDCRFDNEVEAIKKRNGILIKIERPFPLRFPELYQQFLASKHIDIGEYLKETDIEMYKKLFHESETALDNYTDFDYVIVNKGTIEELVEKVGEILIKENII